MNKFMESEKIYSFTDLKAWKQGHELVLFVYEKTKHFPQSEIFGITNQMRRAAVSITSNIAEGFSRGSNKEKAQFYSIALGSLTELQSQAYIARDVGFISKEDFFKMENLMIVVSKLINGLRRIRFQ